MNRCIQCYRCVRFLQVIGAGGKDLDVFAAHNHVLISWKEKGWYSLRTNLVETWRKLVRLVFLQIKPLKELLYPEMGHDHGPLGVPHCSLGCNIIAGERKWRAAADLQLTNGAVNGYFICDRGRYG